jgi:hypothetical protein
MWVKLSMLGFNNIKYFISTVAVYNKIKERDLT